MSFLPFTPQAYGEIVDALDKIVEYMKREYGKSEDEAQAWMESFVREHYFPVWRAMNPTEQKVDQE
jgi:hypothetical protein